MLRNLSTLVLMLLLATPLVAVAQTTGTLAGRVTDDLGDPLPGASVVIQGTQLGTATDVDGNYRIIGIPVGQHDVQASFIGYEPQTVQAVQISSGYTTQQDFRLVSDTEQLGEVIVEYERPIIQRDAVGVPRVVTGEELENLPVRGVASVAALQGGVVANAGVGGLFVRGGRSQEVAYYVDGVKITTAAALAVNQQSIAEQEMLIGTIPARYGDVQSGVISITTKSGGSEFFGSVEAITSEVLDAYGYNTGSLSLGGPILPGRASFFASIAGQTLADASPFGVPIYSLKSDARDFLLAHPQSFRLNCTDPGTCEGGDVIFAAFTPENIPSGTPWADILEDPGAYGIEIPEGYGFALLRDDENRVQGPVLVQTAETLTPDQFVSQKAKDNPYRNLTFNGNVTADLLQTLSLRLGGAFETSREETFSYSGSLYNPDNYSIDDRQSYRVYGTVRHRLAENAFYQLQAEYSNFDRTYHPQRFSDDIRDIVYYGDVHRPENARASEYLIIQGPNLATQARSGALGSRAAFSTFLLPGALSSTYLKQQNSTLRFSGSATTQLGVHQLEFGAEFEQQTRRLFQLVGSPMAGYMSGPDGPTFTYPGMPEEGVESYDELGYEAFKQTGSSYLYYGYSFNGLEKVNSQDISAFAAGENYNVAPYKPIYYAGYIQDKIEYRDLVINLGLRVDVFDNNTQVLRDMYAPYPITRAGDLDNFEDFASVGIGSDYAAYFSNTNDLSTIVGFRDLDGNFYDLDGNRINRQLVESTRSGRVNVLDEGLSPEMFVDYEPQVTFMPRVGVSFPVTDRALFFASYNVTGQRPTEAAFTPFSVYDGLSIGTVYQNPDLKPERTTQYELGFRQRVGERAAVTLSGFYRTQKNKIAMRDMQRQGAGDRFAYTTYHNVDFTTAKGVELGFELRRTSNVAIDANYTLSFAEGTGSDANTASNIAWLTREFPNILAPTDFDRRHSLSASVDYRLGEGEGPELFGARPLANFGFNVLGTFRSGLPYTPAGSVLPLWESAALPAEGTINNTRLPSVTQVDLRIDRSFDVGFGALKAYLWVQNLLDTRGVLSVHRYSGLPGSSGFLSSRAGQQFLSNEAQNGLYEQALFNLQRFEGGPVNPGNSGYVSGTASGLFYTPPRRIRLGILFNF